MTPVAVPSTTSATVQSPPSEALKKSQGNTPVPPIDRIWRGDRAGKVTLAGRPNFHGDKYAERQWIKEHMVCPMYDETIMPDDLPP